MIEPERIHFLNDKPVARTGPVVYWMQQAQRAYANPALEYALDLAREQGRGCYVVFGLMDDYPEANARHYAFMLQGLADVAAHLKERGIGFVLRHGHPAKVAVEAARSASAVITDRGYLRHQREWRETLARDAPVRVVEIDCDTFVPIEAASSKHETQARTIRPRIHRVWNRFGAVPEARPAPESSAMVPDSDFDPFDPAGALERLTLDRSVPPVRRFAGGREAGLALLKRFTDHVLKGYAEGRNEPAAGETSFLSAYLHFGQVSPAELVAAVRAAAPSGSGDAASFVEELVVRRELAVNFVWYRRDEYDRYECLPGWALKTLDAHRDDPRDPHYSPERLEAAETDDPYWNAAMREMIHTGYMHNYMRMYWGKKILEWSASPEDAFYTTLRLNNRYFLDGRDANSYANVGWIFGLHDRAWTERPIFGKTRYMNANGLKRKFDMAAYVKLVEHLVAREGVA